MGNPWDDGDPPGAGGGVRGTAEVPPRVRAGSVGVPGTAAGDGSGHS